MLLMSSSDQNFVQLVVYKKGQTQFWSIYASENKVYSKNTHDYGLKINSIEYHLNSLMIIQTSAMEKRRISVPVQNKKEEKESEASDEYKQVEIKKNYYINILLGETLHDTKPKFLSEGEIKNVYIEGETGLLTIEIFGVVPMVPDELKKLTG
jgi:hypothetical protein